MSRVFVENIDEGAHTADLRCGATGCDYAAEGVNLQNHAQVKYGEVIEDVTIEGNVSESVADKASLPDPTTLTVNDLRHVMDDESGIEKNGQHAPDLYVVVDNGGTNEWRKVNSSVVVTCPTCGMSSAYPCFDPGNNLGRLLGRAKTNG